MLKSLAGAAGALLLASAAHAATLGGPGAYAGASRPVIVTAAPGNAIASVVADNADGPVLVSRDRSVAVLVAPAAGTNLRTRFTFDDGTTRDLTLAAVRGRPALWVDVARPEAAPSFALDTHVAVFGRTAVILEDAPLPISESWPLITDRAIDEIINPQPAPVRKQR